MQAILWKEQGAGAVELRVYAKTDVEITLKSKGGIWQSAVVPYAELMAAVEGIAEEMANHA